MNILTPEDHDNKVANPSPQNTIHTRISPFLGYTLGNPPSITQDNDHDAPFYDGGSKSKRKSSTLTWKLSI